MKLAVITPEDISAMPDESLDEKKPVVIEKYMLNDYFYSSLKNRQN